MLRFRVPNMACGGCAKSVTAARRPFASVVGTAAAAAFIFYLVLPGLALAEQLYRAVAAQGFSRKGTHALMLALAQLSATDWKPSSAAGS